MSQIDENTHAFDKPDNDTPSPAHPSQAAHDPYKALRFRDFRFLVTGTFLNVIGEQVFIYAIGWELYDRTNSPLALGLVGLLQVLPVFFLALPAGHVADIFNRKWIVMSTESVALFCALGLAVLSYTRGSLIIIYGLILLMAVATSFANPASSAMLPQTLPEEAYENAATWHSNSWQLASVIGPAFGGVLVALFHGAMSAYITNAVFVLLYITAVFCVRSKQKLVKRSKDDTALRSLAEGVRFLTRTQILLAAITLDMFAVLLGGATTLLPVFAKDILHVGPLELGWLRSAQSIGAICMAFLLLHRPPFQRAGRTLLLAVVGFGIATIIFGLSHSFWLSLLMLFLLGGLDNISVIIRSALLFVRVPDEMRGRVSAINTIFLGASNQLGSFESGLTAQLFGPVLSVVGGGLGTILVVLLVAMFVPELRRLKTLQQDPQR